MTRFRIVALSSGVALATSLAIAIAGTPFGADDEGTIPSDAPKGPVTKCESKVAKAADKLVGSIIKCHAGRTTGKFADDKAENTCEAKAVSKFGAIKTAGCTGCTDIGSIGSLVEEPLDGNNNLVYCDATGTPFGVDENGFIPPDAPKGPETKCSTGIGKAVGKLIRSFTKCHISRVTGKFTSNSAEDTCESTAEAKFATTKTAGCPACIALPELVAFVEALSENELNGFIWCGSPSGAFLQ